MNFLLRGGGEQRKIRNVGDSQLWLHEACRTQLRAAITGRLSLDPEFIVYLGDCETARDAAQRGGPGFRHLEKHLRAHVNTVAEKYPGWTERWWQPLRPQIDFFAPASLKPRFIVCSNPQARPIYAFLSARFMPTNTMQVFAFDDDYSFGIIQSHAHWAWLKAKGGKVRQDMRYTSEVWRTFPWPQEVSTAVAARVATAARELRVTREQLMEANGWSLRALHQAAEVEGPHALKDAQRALDEAVAEAYGLASDQELTEFLLDLNRFLVEDEAQGKSVAGPGLPPGLDPKDPRWFSDDCIEPPPFPE